MVAYPATQEKVSAKRDRTGLKRPKKMGQETFIPYLRRLLEDKDFVYLEWHDNRTFNLKIATKKLPAKVTEAIKGYNGGGFYRNFSHYGFVATTDKPLPQGVVQQYRHKEDFFLQDNPKMECRIKRRPKTLKRNKVAGAAEPRGEVACDTGGKKFRPLSAEMDEELLDARQRSLTPVPKEGSPFSDYSRSCYSSSEDASVAMSPSMPKEGSPFSEYGSDSYCSGSEDASSVAMSPKYLPMPKEGSPFSEYGSDSYCSSEDASSVTRQLFTNSPVGSPNVQASQANGLGPFPRHYLPRSAINTEHAGLQESDMHLGELDTEGW